MNGQTETPETVKEKNQIPQTDKEWCLGPSTDADLRGPEDQTGSFQIKSPYQVDPQVIQAAINAVVLEDLTVSKAARTSYHCFVMIADQVCAKVPDAHPMDIYLQLHARLNADSPNLEALQSAFKLGVEVATTLRHGTNEFKQSHLERVAEVPDQAFAVAGQMTKLEPGHSFAAPKA